MRPLASWISSAPRSSTISPATCVNARPLRRRARAVVGARAGHVVEVDAAHVAVDAEVAVVQALVREAGQVAAHVEAHVVHLAGRERGGEVAARLGQARLRQVAREARGAGVGQHALQVDAAGEAPAAAELALADAPTPPAGAAFGPLCHCSCSSPSASALAKRTSSQRHRDRRRLRGVARRLDLPARVGGEAVERDHRLLEHAGQLDAAAVERQVRRAAALAGVEGDVGVAPARPAAARALGNGAGGHRRSR